jgi:ligand-binding sensor domain-containing protein
MTPVDSDLPEPDVNDIMYDPDSDLFWVALATEGLATVDLEASKWTFYTTSNGLPSNYVYSIAKVDGTIWVATQNGIARQRAGGSWQGYDSGGGLKADRVRRLYADIPTRIWLSYVQAGAGVVLPQTAE